MKPDPKLDALEDIRCDEMAREERREQREDAHRAEDRREREEARRRASMPPPALRAAPSPHAPLPADDFDDAARSATQSLSGLWLGHYGGDRYETIRIEQDGPSINATKVTGDTNVPAGRPTFRATMVGREGDGAGHAADEGYSNPRWVAGRLTIVGEDEIVFTFISEGRSHPVRLKRIKP